MIHMKPIHTLGVAAGAVLVGALTLSGATLPTGNQDGIQVGAVATYQFRAAPVNARGVNSLDDLRGKPVLIDFWGTR